MRGLLHDRSDGAATPRPRARAVLRGRGNRSAGEVEAGGLDLGDEIVGAAAVDTEGASEPLPGLAGDVLVDPVPGGCGHRRDRDDRAVIGYQEVRHGDVSWEGDPSTPRPRRARGTSGERF